MARKATGGAALGVAVIEMAVKYLRSDAGKAQLRKAPEAIRWARNLARPKRPYPNAIDAVSHEADAGEDSAALGPGAPPSTWPRFNPADRLGRRGLERRIAALHSGFAVAFADGQHTELADAVEALGRAIQVGGDLPLVKRQRLYRRVDRQLDELEAALLEAALPRQGPPSPR